MNKTILLSASAVVIIILVLLTYPFPNEVTRVIDGDTLVLDNGERVRLLGIDTPEKGQPLFSESTQYLEKLVEGKLVVLEPGQENRDKYGRLLRWIKIGGNLVNLDLVEKGLARTFMLYEDDLYYRELLDAESRARNAGLGIWSYDLSDFCLALYTLNYNAPGNDNQNLNQEYIVFRNKCNQTLDLSGWRVSDARNNTYIFPNLTLDPKDKLTLHTGSGNDTQHDLYWGRGRAVWNNQGDTLLTWDSSGRLLLNHTYQ